MEDNKSVQMSTGLPGLDKILFGIRSGDNIVWQVDSIDDYLPFVEPLIANAIAPKNCTRISESIIDKFGILLFPVSKSSTGWH